MVGMESDTRKGNVLLEQNREGLLEAESDEGAKELSSFHQ